MGRKRYRLSIATFLPTLTLLGNASLWLISPSHAHFCTFISTFLNLLSVNHSKMGTAGSPQWSTNHKLKLSLANLNCVKKWHSLITKNSQKFKENWNRVAAIKSRKRSKRRNKRKRLINQKKRKRSLPLLPLHLNQRIPLMPYLLETSTWMTPSAFILITMKTNLYLTSGRSLTKKITPFGIQNTSMPKIYPKIFMTCNLIGGMFQRVDKLRKNAFASVGVFGEDGNNNTSGIWVWRGHELCFPLNEDWTVDYESYDWKKLDADAPETRKLVDQYFKWIGEDNKGRKFNQGKIFK